MTKNKPTSLQVCVSKPIQGNLGGFKPHYIERGQCNEAKK